METRDEFAPPRLWWDPLATLSVLLVSFGLLNLWDYPLFHPSLWEEMAVGAGLRPPDGPFPCLYRACLAFLFWQFPKGQALDILPYLGRATLSCTALFTYLIFRKMLPATLCVRVSLGKIGAAVGRLGAALAALLLVCADPVWRAGQSFSPVSLFLLLTSAAVWCFSRFERRGQTGSLYLCAVLLGVVSSENLLGLVISVLGLVGLFLVVRRAARPDTVVDNPLVDGLVRQVVLRRLACVWGTSFVAALGFNVWWFLSSNGLEASGSVGVLGVVFEYVRGIWVSVRDAASLWGWFFFVLFGVIPFMLTVKVLPKAWDDDRMLHWNVGVAYLLMGAVALMPLVGWGAFWFWTWLVNDTLVSSETLLAFMLVLDVATFSIVVTVFGIDVYCRNYRRLTRQLFPERVVVGQDEKTALESARKLRQRLFWLLVVFVPICVVPGRCQPVERDMLAEMKYYARAFEDEAGDCDVAFTDGSFDCLHELMRLRGEKPLRCLPLIADRTARARTRARVLRLRASCGEEDTRLLTSDATTALQAWVAAGTERLKTCAVQMGFEIWRRDSFSMPDILGVVARPKSSTDLRVEVQVWARARLARLADELTTLAQTGGPAKCHDYVLRRLFACLMYRVARIAQMRSLVADQAGRRDEAIRQAAIADGLDESNYLVKDLRLQFDWQNAQGGGSSVLSPREGLALGLARGDYTFAAKCAATVLKSDPDDLYANFAMGMKLFREEHWALAEEHLKKSLARRTNDIAVLNNLALVQIRLGKLDEAERNVRVAIKFNGQVPELHKTLEQVLAARKSFRPESVRQEKRKDEK